MNRSRHVSVVVGFLLFVFAAGASPAFGQGLGIAAGLNFSSQSDIRTSSVHATFENATGYHVGLDYQIGLGPLALRPGVIYQRIGDYHFPSGEKLTLSDVEIPVDVELRPLPLPVVRPYVLAGPVLTFPRGQGDLGNGVHGAALTGDVGIGLDISPPILGLHLMPELRYSKGLSDYLKKSFQVGGETIQPSSGSRRVAGVMLRLHVYF